jgi:hypothetical protein
MLSTIEYIQLRDLPILYKTFVVPELYGEAAAEPNARAYCDVCIGCQVFELIKKKDYLKKN